MNQTRPRRRLLVLVMLAGLTVPAGGQGATQFQQWNRAVMADPVELKPAGSCAALISMTGYDFSVTSATVVAASADWPEYCRVVGLIQPEVRFDVSLPAVWNGRLYMFGNGGYAGESLDGAGRVATARRALARGFAVAQTNTGHDGAVEQGASFAASPQKFLDYAYRAVHVTVMTAKSIAGSYYNSAPRRSYFDGCSTGGRQGLISAQRFPDDFDGIVVGAPVLNFSGTMLNYNVMQRALRAAPLSAEKLKLLATEIYAHCDRRDEVADGVIEDPRQCGFDPATHLSRCTGTDGASCFTDAEIASLNAIYRPTMRNGNEFFPGWPVGAETGSSAPGQAPLGANPSSAWIPWFVAGPKMPRSIQEQFGETFMRYMAFGRSNPEYDWMTFDLEKDYDKLLPTRMALDATDPNLMRFRDRGGKIVSYFGWADQALNPMMGIQYYESVSRTMGPSTTNFYRLFMVPGLFHCGGGVGVNSFDPFTPLVEWVEKGTAPATIPASRLVEGKAVMTRPLCPYPEIARYKGSASTDDAANFTCAKP
jgi:Tannase and feruloyl esterase